MDTIKGLACIFVVFIHFNWSDDLSETIKAIGRFAVPFFFFVSGYHLPGKNGGIEATAVRRKLFHILKMLGKAAIVYSIFCVLWNYFMDSNWELLTFVRDELSWWGFVKLFITCDPFVYGHFWYMIALVLCYLVILALRDWPGKIGYWILFAVLLCVYSLLAEFKDFLGWSNYYYITETSRMVLSNIFLLRALPFLLFGICLKKCRVADCAVIPFGVLLILALVGCILAGVEQKRFGVILMYTGNHLMVIALALMCVWYPQKKLALLEYVGGKLSMNVYLYHIAAGKTLDLLVTKLHLWNSGYKMLRPVFALAVSLLTAILLKILTDYKNQKKKGLNTAL